MIIDSHAYCFEPADDPAGHTDSETHRRWIQASYSVHHQPAIRLRDRAQMPGATAALDPTGAHDLDNLPDRNLRFDRDEGRVLWEHDGETCTKYFYPPNLTDGAYSPMSLISEMDYAGIDLALLHTNPMLGAGEDYAAFLRECIEAYPDRLRAMAPVDESLIASEPDLMLSGVERAIRDYRLHALKFNASLTYMGCLDPWDDGPYRPFWQAVTSLDIPVFFTLGSRPAALRGEASAQSEEAGYLEELKTLVRWMNRYPDTICSITHGFPYRMYRDENCIKLPKAIWEPFENQNCHMEVCFPVRIGDWFDFPYKEVQSTLAEMLDKIGARRLLWGTDMPFQNRFCTYRQSRDWIERYCGFLSEEELEWIMGGTASQILNLGATDGLQ